MYHDPLRHSPRLTICPPSPDPPSLGGIPRATSTGGRPGVLAPPGLSPLEAALGEIRLYTIGLEKQKTNLFSTRRKSVHAGGLFFLLVGWFRFGMFYMFDIEMGSTRSSTSMEVVSPLEDEIWKYCFRLVWSGIRSWYLLDWRLFFIPSGNGNDVIRRSRFFWN